MAIINSVFMGRAKKSAGGATFRVVRGRTIASQKIAKKGTQTGKMSLNQYALACISRFAALKAGDISVSFDATTYGSKRNAFFKLNYDQLKLALKSLYTESLKHDAATMPSDAEILAAVAEYASKNKQAIYRVKRAGFAVVYLTGEWSSEQNPEEPTIDNEEPDSGSNGGGGNTGGDNTEME